MGFDIIKAISKLSSVSKKKKKLSSKSHKQGKLSKTLLLFSIPEEPNGLDCNPEQKPSTTTATHHARGQKRKVVKSVKFVDCDCDRNVKVAPYAIDTSFTTTTTTNTTTTASNPKFLSSSTQSNGSTPLPHPSPSSEIKRLPLDPNATPISSNEDPPPPPIVPRSPANSSIGSVTNDKPTKPHKRLPSPQGLHSRNLSYGTIYKAFKTSSSSETPTCSRDDRSNAKAVTSAADKASKHQGTSAKPHGRSTPHVFGLGGCNYGHGSIINGMKSIKTGIKANNNGFVLSCEKDDLVGRGKQSCPLVSSSSSTGEAGPSCTVEELKSMGNGEYRKGQFKKAISFYDKAIGLDPLNAACHHNKASALACLGRIREAVEECHQALNCDLTYNRAHYRLGTLYTRLGQIEDGKKHFRLSGHKDSSEAVQRMLAVDGYLKSMKKALQIEDWETVLAESSNSLEGGADACDEAIAAKAEALLKLHRVNEALEIVIATKNIEDRKPRSACSRLLLLEAQMYLYLGRFEEAVRSAEKAVNTEFDTESLLQLKKAWGAADAHRAGSEYYIAGKFSEACAMYAQGLQYLPSNGFLLYKRGTCRIKMGQLERAVEDLNTALKINPNHSEAILQRAQALTQLGRWENALRDYLVLRKQRPTDHTVSNLLFQVQMELKRNKMPVKAHTALA